jgi:alkyl hydroperoxide reductase subunit F
MEYDLSIIGGGPSGMTAGVFAVRKGLKTILISEDIGGQVNWTTDIENYMGFYEIDGQALMQKFEDQMKEHHLEEKLTRVQSVRKEKEVFRIVTAEKEEVVARSVIVCPGKKPKTLNVPGEKEFRNKGVSYCSTCDGPLFRNVAVAVVGGGNSAVKAVLDLANYAAAIHLVSLTQLTADAILIQRLAQLAKLQQHLECRVVEIQGTNSVERLIIETGSTKQHATLEVAGVFIEIGLDPNTAFLGQEIRRNQAAEIEIDCFCRTNIPGLFAAGDATSVPEKQIIIAAGEGAKAAIKAWEYLLEAPERTH